jgi:hypothetical protein
MKRMETAYLSLKADGKLSDIPGANADGDTPH